MSGSTTAADFKLPEPRGTGPKKMSIAEGERDLVLLCVREASLLIVLERVRVRNALRCSVFEVGRRIT